VDIHAIGLEAEAMGRFDGRTDVAAEIDEAGSLRQTAIPLDLLHRALNLAVGLGGIKRVRGIFFVDRRDLVERRCRMDEMEAAALATEDAISMRCSGEPEIRAAADDAGRRFRSVLGCLCWFCL